MALSWVLLAYAAVAAGSAFAALRIHDDYLAVMQDERAGLRGVTAALTSATQTMLDHGLGAALTGASAVHAAGGLDRLAPHALGSALQRQLAGGTYVRALFLQDSGHFVLASATRLLDTANTPAYLAGMTAAADVWVGNPIHDPQDGGPWVVPIARRVRIDPTTSGWAGALISFTRLEQLHQRFGSVVSEQGLVGFDGTILASFHNRYTGRSVAQSSLFRRAIATAPHGGITEGWGAFIHEPMIYAHYPLRGYPIHVVAGQSQDAVLAGWRSRRRQMIAATASFSALIPILTAFLSHYMRELRTRERDYNTLVDSARFGVFLLEGDRFVDANRTVAAMFGLASERQAIGLTPWELSPERQPNGRSSQELARERILTGSFFTPKVGKMVVDGYLRNPASPEELGASALSAREREIVQLLAEGKSSKEVATALGISVKTAETHRSNIMRKGGFGSLAELVRYAIRNRIIEP